MESLIQAADNLAKAVEATGVFKEVENELTIPQSYKDVREALEKYKSLKNNDYGTIENQHAAINI